MTLTILLDEAKLETGLWCGRCLLPSGWRVPLLSVSLAGVAQIGTVARCDECDQGLGPQ